MVCGFSKTESNSYRTWNPKTCRVVERRNVVFIKTSPNLFPAARRLSPQQDLESPSYDVSDDTIDDNYVSYDDMLRTSRTTTALWIPASTRLQERLNCFYLNKPYPA